MNNPMTGGDIFTDDDLPPGWIERASDDGSVVYINTTTGASTFQHPSTGKRNSVPKELPFGWVEDFEGPSKVFVNVSTGQRTTIDPRLAFKVEDTHTYRARFGGNSSCWDVLEGIDLSTKTILVTGGSCGIGWETARSLAAHGAQVVVTSRNVSSTNTAIQELQKERRTFRMSAMFVDLCDLNSVRTFAFEFKKTYNALHILILNAGVYGHPYEKTKDGFETTFQVNHLSQFYLLRLLSSLLEASSPARVIVLSSESHRFSFLTTPSHLSIDRLSPPEDKHFWSLVAYNDSKLLNVWFARELDRRMRSKGVKAFAVHPGNMINTSISRYWWFWRLLFWMMSPFTKTLAQGAATSVYGAVAPELADLGGLYLNNCAPCTPSKPALDDKMGEKLWALSERLLKEKNMN
ncbi:WW domain-containing oxidoreductase-like [Tropilaelaps mercedesae]|uniref:WW domain-containing oxidoreductase n=1 Tax=Tropilaelaps mercedesae TaxID=418985 RepID=A0A1V9Y134_9ACAR|nr:WW domain-containing oxidoreductase-like [Tropilaelaps mercedesae]